MACIRPAFVGPVPVAVVVARGATAVGGGVAGPLVGLALSLFPSSTASPWQDEGPGSWTEVGRYWGGAAGPWGRSWGPANMSSDIDPRSTWGIPNINTMTHFTSGWIRTEDLNNPTLVIQRQALPADGYPGGGQEYLFKVPPQSLIRGTETVDGCKS